jgi:hypothetical protein
MGRLADPRRSPVDRRSIAGRSPVDRWSIAATARRSPLAAAARRVIDEITMWYLGSVPHQPDVSADASADDSPDVSADASASAASTVAAAVMD